MTQRPSWFPEGFGPGSNALLQAAGIDLDDLYELVALAITEDLAGSVDVTTASTVPATQSAILELTARKPGVVAGAAVAAAVFDMVSRHEANWEILAADGTEVKTGDVILRVKCKTRALLTGERTALNFLGHLSGIATATHEWVKALEGTSAKVRDTRKTTPGMRQLEKWAVRCGGGVNHRMSLADAALVKDNHVVAAGGVVEAFAAVRQRFPDIPLEIEVDSLEQLREVVEAGADLVLLDNFTTEQMREAVTLVAGRAKLEASGGLTLANAREVAATGVDYIAVGAITHSAPVLDIGGDLYANDGGEDAAGN